MYADVLIEYNTKVLDKTFTYSIPPTLKVKAGNKVKVSFANKTILGIVTNIKNESDVEKVNEIIEVVNPDIVLTKELLELGEYLSKITFTTLIKAYQTMLPSSLKVKKIETEYNKYLEYIELNKSEEEIKDYIKNNQRSKSQIDILNRLLNK